MKFVTKKNIGIVVMILIILVSFTVPSHSWWIFGGDEKENVYKEKFPLAIENSDSKVVFLAPAEDLSRVRDYENAWSKCPHCTEFITTLNKAMILFYEMHQRMYNRYWAFALDIPRSEFLLFNKKSEFAIIGTNADQDTISVNSEFIVFCLGWGFPSQDQHTVLRNTENPIYVRPIGEELTVNDFEWTRPKDKRLIIGYARFEEGADDIKEVIDFNISGVNSGFYEKKGGN